MLESREKTENLEQNYQYTFTVFTATYNRAHTLNRVYESLKEQSFRDFEWLIVDDGSKDNTRSLVETWQAESLFPIRYFHQQNQGKHIAYNFAVQEARGGLFLDLDSDDSCKPETLERFKIHWDSIPETLQHQFFGLGCLCQDEKGEILGDTFPSNPTDSNALEIRYRYKLTGEKWILRRTDILKHYPFPELPGYPNIPPTLITNKISRKYKIRFFNEALRTYSTGDDQISKTFSTKNSLIKILQHQTILNTELDYFRYFPSRFYTSSIHYIRYSFHQGDSLNTQARKINSKLGLMIWLTGLLPGYFVYLKDLIKYSE